MKLSSTAFEYEGTIPTKYTCDGEVNICPPLEFSEVPALAQSLVLIMDDHDVPLNLRPDGVWDHFVEFNIPPTTKHVGEGTTIHGVSGIGSGGKTIYEGPCPPDREHRYMFRLYALDTELALHSGATKQEVLSEMEGHVIDSADLMGRYDRKR